MNSTPTIISSALRKDMERKGIDIGLSLEILENYNAGSYDSAGQVIADGVPLVDGEAVIDLRPDGNPDRIIFSCPIKDAKSRLAEHGCDYSIGELISPDIVGYRRKHLLEIGIGLLSKTAYGVLNGGSATSYTDVKKNRSFDSITFDVLEPEFRRYAPGLRHMPKGMTPAYFNPDGSPGASFLELKMRARLLLASSLKEQKASSLPELPLFQMTSSSTYVALSEFYPSLRDSPFLKDLALETDLDAVEWMSGV